MHENAPQRARGHPAMPNTDEPQKMVLTQKAPWMSLGAGAMLPAHPNGTLKSSKPCKSMPWGPCLQCTVEPSGSAASDVTANHAGTGGSADERGRGALSLETGQRLLPRSQSLQTQEGVGGAPGLSSSCTCWAGGPGRPPGLGLWRCCLGWRQVPGTRSSSRR